MSISICQPLTAAPSFLTATLPWKPLFQLSTVVNWPSMPVEGGVAGGGSGTVGGGGGGGVGAGVGAGVPSMMVAVPVARASVAPCALVSTTVNCSLGSLSESDVMGMAIVWLCWPGAKVSVPLVGVKSPLP